MEDHDNSDIGSKRNYADHDEYGEISYKRAKSDVMTLRLLMLGKLCGCVIGKGGENIKRLRKQYSCQVNIPDTRSNDRILSIIGEKENCLEVLKEIIPKCVEAPYPVDSKDKPPLEINLLINTDRVGGVIGKGGLRIREIRDESNGKVKVYQECLPDSDERIVAVGGDVTAVENAVHIIFDSLRDERPRRGGGRLYDPKSQSSGGMGPNSGPMGNNGPMGNAGMFGNQNVLNNDLSGAIGLLGQLGNAGAGGILGTGGILGSRLPGLNLWNQDGRSGDAGGNQSGNRNAGGYHSREKYNRDYNGGGGDLDADFLQMKTVTQITLPNEMCGAIIGKGGSRIREIRDKSGARVEFSASEKGSKEDREITLYGTQEQVQMAEQLMTQCVRNRNY